MGCSIRGLASLVVGLAVSIAPSQVRAVTYSWLVASIGNDKVQQYSDSGTWEKTFATASGTYMNDPSSLALGADGYVYVGYQNVWGADATDAGIMKLAQDGNTSVGAASAFNAALHKVTDLQWGADGYLYYGYASSTAGAGGIARLSSTGSVDGTFNGNTGKYRVGTDSEAIRGLAIKNNGDGTIDIFWNQAATTYRRTIRGGAVSGATSYNNGATRSMGAEIGPDGKLYVTRYSNQDIQSLNLPSGSTTFSTYSAAGNMAVPIGMAWAADGSLLVNDCNNNVVKKFDSTGAYKGVFISAGSGNSALSSPNQGLIKINDTAINLSSGSDLSLGRKMLGNSSYDASRSLANGAGHYDQADYTASATNGIQVQNAGGSVNGGASGGSISFGVRLDTSSTGAKSGTVSVTNTYNVSDNGSGVKSFNVTGAVVDNRVVTASSVALGRVFVNDSVSGVSQLSTTGDNDHFTAVTVAGTLFNSASSSGTYELNTSFGSAGHQSGSQSLTITSEGLIGESPLGVSVDYAATVLDHAKGSFAGDSLLKSLVIDFGKVDLNGSVNPRDYSLYNLVTTTGYTNSLDLLSVEGTGDTAKLTTTAASFSDFAAGGLKGFTASLDTSEAGVFGATYRLHVRDSGGVTGALADNYLTLTLQGVVAIPEPNTLVLMIIGGFAVVLFAPRRRK